MRAFTCFLGVYVLGIVGIFLYHQNTKFQVHKIQIRINILEHVCLNMNVLKRKYKKIIVSRIRKEIHPTTHYKATNQQSLLRASSLIRALFGAAFRVE